MSDGIWQSHFAVHPTWRGWPSPLGASQTESTTSTSNRKRPIPLDDSSHQPNSLPITNQGRQISTHYSQATTQIRPPSPKRVRIVPPISRNGSEQEVSDSPSTKDKMDKVYFECIQNIIAVFKSVRPSQYLSWDQLFYEGANCKLPLGTQDCIGIIKGMIHAKNLSMRETQTPGFQHAIYCWASEKFPAIKDMTEDEEEDADNNSEENATYQYPSNQATSNQHTANQNQTTPPELKTLERRITNCEEFDGASTDNIFSIKEELGALKRFVSIQNRQIQDLTGQTTLLQAELKSQKDVNNVHREFTAKDSERMAGRIRALEGANSRQEMSITEIGHSMAAPTEALAKQQRSFVKAIADLKR